MTPIYYYPHWPPSISYQIIYKGAVRFKKSLNLTPLPKNLKEGDFFINFFISIVFPKQDQYLIIKKLKTQDHGRD